MKLYQITINGNATKFIFDNLIELNNAIDLLKVDYNVNYLIINL